MTSRRRRRPAQTSPRSLARSLSPTPRTHLCTHCEVFGPLFTPPPAPHPTTLSWVLIEFTHTPHRPLNNMGELKRTVYLNLYLLVKLVVLWSLDLAWRPQLRKNHEMAAILKITHTRRFVFVPSFRSFQISRQSAEACGRNRQTNILAHKIPNAQV